MKHFVIGSTLALGVVLAAPMSAQAGEYNGQGGTVPGASNASSECAYSGRDVPDDVEDNPPGFDDDAITGGRVQSYGQYVRAGLKAVLPSPGEACRGNLR